MKEEDEEEDLFYESLDRILSASCSSTSNSDEESDERLRLRRRVPCFPPPAATSYDVWISEPSSIEDRRHRLLHQLGLAGDPTLSRRKSPFRSRSDGDRCLDLETPQYVSDYGSGDLDRSCTIKNLDNGEEFVVKEDGVRNRTRDLTVEEFEMCVGRSPIVQELMRRQNVEDFGDANGGCSKENGGLGLIVGSRKKGGWLKRIKKMAGNVVAGGYYRERRSSEERDSSSEKRGGRRSSSATDDSQDGWLNHGPEWIRVRQYGKSWKEFNGLCLTQENQAHTGSIWCIKFSLDGKYLASAGEDCMIHVWQVSVIEKKVDLENGYRNNPFVNAGSNELPESTLLLACVEGNHWEKKRRARLSNGRKSVSSGHFVVPDQLFALEEKPVCSFKGHLADVLDLSWSKSEYLLSSSMDKTVRLWHMSSNTCLKTFSHTDYVTCIQFNPVDDRYFISGSLDEKVRIWSIPDRQIVDWNDLHEMVTSACYTPDGQGALVGSHKGSCHLYGTSDNKLHHKSQIDLQNRKKKSSQKKITGFQFAPGSLSEVFITSADSRIRVVDGTELVHKFKGFRNTSSQIAASLASNGKYVVCASEDSHVYIWRADAADAQPQASRSRVVSVTQSYEHFHCRDVTVAVPWPGGIMRSHSNGGASRCNLVDEQNNSSNRNDNNIVNDSILSASTYPFGDRVAATWPEEKLLTSSNHSSLRRSLDLSNGRMHLHSRSALGMVIVTAGRSGQIRTFQNFGSPS